MEFDRQRAELLRVGGLASAPEAVTEIRSSLGMESEREDVSLGSSRITRVRQFCSSSMRTHQPCTDMVGTPLELRKSDTDTYSPTYNWRNNATVWSKFNIGLGRPLNTTVDPTRGETYVEDD